MKRRILNTEITFTDYPTLMNKIYEKTGRKEKFAVTYANSYLCNYADRDSSIRECLEKFDLVHADGIAVYLASKFLYGSKEHTERVNGTDLYYKLFNSESDPGFFILGGPEKTKELLENRYKKKIKGFVYKISDNEDCINRINNSSAGILMVALGTPEQELWIIENREKINVPVIIAAGSGIDYLTGEKKRAPGIMRKTGFEWLFRLFQEPSRLWKRYLFENPFFIFKISAQKVKLLIKKENT